MIDQWRSNGRSDVRRKADSDKPNAKIPSSLHHRSRTIWDCTSTSLPPDMLANFEQNWLNTPDGREGWASYFLSQGYTLYLTDQPQRGRSPWLPGDGTLSVYNVSSIQNYFTTIQAAKLWPQASLHTQVHLPSPSQLKINKSSGPEPARPQTQHSTHSSPRSSSNKVI